MNASEIVANIAQAFGTRRRNELLSFADLVRTVADDKPADPAKATQILRDAGKTPTDLEKEVQRLRDRRAWRAAVKKADGIDAKKTSLAEKVLAIRTKHEAARIALDKKLESDLEPFRAEEAEITRIEQARDDALSGLRVSGQSAQSLAEIAALREQIQGLRRDMKACVKPWGAEAESARELRSRAGKKSQGMILDPDGTDAAKATALEKLCAEREAHAETYLSRIRELESRIASIEAGFVEVE